ncbi:LYR motif-containing protein 1-like [Patiria miniata]|uniref:Complex 1 LYR protein domain-containing protein n=1 Tax=Patiria miniata TaxID=46514 RepID=A0A914AK98_PATMI|nr:LYR motif-containing protein 1-like [Patiria miniata]XP_038064156.1 LYR motif-containing protein 1-like [Patiria miniata]XP_038064157.1 LYR motif-containing protein 1-like [Patiria miniata]XP_038064158.1 LYR motif-containing protein 1-like [Patiria miniata]XP_038064159.1 LYR motif-containing protein 1-like [Patiria miniata]
MALRREVLSLYRTLLCTAKTWQASTKLLKDTREEQQYIRDETRTLFKKNKQVTDPEKIKVYIQEAEARLAMALHYQSPYPRPVNIPPMGLPPSVSRGKKAQDRLRQRAKPVYLQSHDEQ